MENLGDAKLFLSSIFVILVISHFGFEGGICSSSWSLYTCYFCRIFIIFVHLISGPSIKPQPLYNMVRYNLVLDITRIIVGPQMVIKERFCYMTHYNKDWIANKEIDLDPNNSAIKRLWCISYMKNVLMCAHLPTCQKGR